MTKYNPLILLGGLGLGAGLMYLLDPDGGRRRRGLARDKAAHGLKVSGQALRKTSIDVGNLGRRTRGLVAEAGSRLRKSGAEIVPAPRRLSLKGMSPRKAALGLGGIGGLGALAGLGLLARSARGKR